MRVEFFGDEIDRICEIDPLTGKIKGVLSHACVYPASHYVVGREKMERALNQIYQEMVERVAYFEEKGKLLEAQRIKERTMNDIEMLRETGFCKGIENYSAVMSGRKPGQPPFTLLDYFPEDFFAVLRRESCDAAPGAGHVRRRPLPQGQSDRLWLSAALRF